MAAKLKRWQKALIALILAATTASVGAYITLAVLWADEPPPWDDDLRLQWAAVADEDNAYVWIGAAAEKVRRPQGGPGEDWWTQEEEPAWEQLSEEERLMRIHAYKGWDGDLAARVLRDNEEALALWQKAMACAEYQPPYPRSLKEEMPQLFGALQLGRLLVLRSMVLAHDARPEEALEEALNVVGFGQRMEGSRDVLIAYLVGRTVKSMGLEQVRWLARDFALPPQRLREAARRLAACWSDGRDLADAFRAEYACTMKTIDDVVARQMGTGRVWGEAEPEDLADKLRKANITTGLVFKPNETRRMFAETHRRLAANALGHWPEMDMKDPHMEERGWVGWVLRGNLIGHMLYYLMAPALPGALGAKCRGNVEVAATRVLLAMKAYKVEKGALPARLQDLVPDYLDAVPLDDFDGRPLRYNREKKVVYSVGKDLQDSGGTTLEDWVAARRREIEEEGWEWTEEDRAWAEEEFEFWDSPDPSFLIEF